MARILPSIEAVGFKEIKNIQTFKEWIQHSCPKCKS